MEIEYHNRKLRDLYENPFLAIKKFNLEDIEDEKLADIMTE